MARKVILELASNFRLKLQYIFERGEDWRVRQRSETLTLLDDGLSMSEVAKIVGIHVRTVGLTRMDWLRRGFDSLKDAVRSGAPGKILPDELKALKDAATLEPLTATRRQTFRGSAPEAHSGASETRLPSGKNSLK